MKKIIILLFSLLAICNSTMAFANITVAAIQPPVWKLQDGKKTALFAGDIVKPQDTLLSGINSRILLNMGEGSGMEFGANTQTVIKKAPEPNKRIAEAVVNILQGAFRFTTGTFAANKARAISINLRHSTVGIRGTDLWGSTNNNNDYVVLIEGNIDINPISSNTLVNVQTPYTVYQTPLASNPSPAGTTNHLPLETISQNSLNRLAQQTRLLDNKPVLYANGLYSVVIGSARKPEHAMQLSKTYQQAGYPVISQQAHINGVSYTRALVNGFKDLAQAQQFTQQLQDELNINDAWILKNSF